MPAIRTLALAVPLLLATTRVAAADVTGKISLTGTAGKPELHGKAFLDRTENPYLGGKTFDPMPYLVVVLEKDGVTLPTPPQVKWKLLGESFDRPLLPVMAGSEVVIQNEGRRSPTLYVQGNEDLLPKTPLNRKGERAFKVTDAGKLLTVVDDDTPYLTGSVLVLDTPYFAGAVSVGKAGTDGKYAISGVADGSYKLKVWYRTGWLDGYEVDVDVKDGKASKDLTLPPGLKIAGATDAPAAEK
jgi:hypothetical protein